MAELRGRVRVLLFELPLVVVPEREQYDVSADGQRFLVCVEQERAATIEVVLNWTGLLQRRESEIAGESRKPG